MLRRIGFIVALAASLAAAGLNADATFVLDMDPSTPEIENERFSSTEGEEFDVAVMGYGLVDLKGLVVVLEYDDAVLTAGTPTLTGHDMSNVLDNSPMSFTNTYDDPARVEITASQMSVSSATEGLLAIFTFTSSVPAGDTTSIVISEIALTADASGAQGRDRFEAPNEAMTDGLYGVLEQFTLTVSAGDDGDVSPSGDQAVVPGDSVEVSADADNGYVFANWTVEAGSGNVVVREPDSATTWVVVNGDATVQANFDIETAVIFANRAATAVWGLEAARNGVVYSIPADNEGAVVLKLFSAEGRMVRSYVAAGTPGKHVLGFAEDGVGALPNGAYLCTMRGRSYAGTVKVLLSR